MDRGAWGTDKPSLAALGEPESDTDWQEHRSTAKRNAQGSGGLIFSPIDLRSGTRACERCLHRTDPVVIIAPISPATLSQRMSWLKPRLRCKLRISRWRKLPR